ncbi:hypothetical protein, partial [Microbacterium sp. C448]|uniref:hypothetical protein n=2 Tax=Microbacteriaceae TaxID=85023 RepID=UPI00055CEF91
MTSALHAQVASFASSEIALIDYVAVVYSVGYETRSTFIASTASQGSHLVGFTFPTQREGQFQKNRIWALEHGAVVEVEAEDQFAQRLRNTLTDVIAAFHGATPDERPRFLVDISSMTRQRIADSIRILHTELGAAVEAHWVYAPATFEGSRVDDQVVVTNGAVSGYEGWGDPSLPVTCVVGAGFEGDLALGVIDDIEPEDVWAFLPRGYSPNHDVELDQLNSSLLHVVEAGKTLEYRVDQPLEALLRLDALLGGEIATRRVVIIPLGPKIFALVASLVALSAPESITLWRLSSESRRQAIDRIPDGSIVGLCVTSQGPEGADPAGG